MTGFLKPGAYWLTRFATVSSAGAVRPGRMAVRVLGAVPGERGRYYRVMLPNGATSIAARGALVSREPQP